MDIVPATKPYYEQLFTMSGQLDKENDKPMQHILGLKDSVRYLDGIIKRSR